MRPDNADLLSTDELAALLGSPDLRLVDATWIAPAQGQDPAALHAAAHLPGAIFFDIDRVAAPPSGLPHMLPDAATFATAAASLGIAAEDHVVVYDQNGIASAACRAWWTFLHFGQRRVSVLDGGLPAWRGAGLPLESGPSAAPAPADRGPIPGRLPVLGREDVLAGIATGAPLVDARSVERHTGAGPEPWGEPGRIPGSLNLPYTELLDDQGRLLPPAALARRVTAAALPDGPLGTYCGSGVTACVLIFALARLGHGGLALYDGSWAEWVRSEGTPRERD